MQVDLSDFLSVTIAVISVCGAIWRIAAIEKDIQIYIKKLEAKLDVFQTSYLETKEHQQYLINDCYGQIRHKSTRLLSDIKELETEINKIKDKL